MLLHAGHPHLRGHRSQLAAAIDSTPLYSIGQSWLQTGSSTTIPNVTTLAGPFVTLVEGNFLIRAVGEECPEPATYVLTGAGLLLATVMRRRG